MADAMRKQAGAILHKGIGTVAISLQRCAISPATEGR
jgi:hypothetical protein